MRAFRGCRRAARYGRVARVKQTELPAEDRGAPSVGDSLRLSGPSLRLRDAMDQHDKLLAKVTRRRRDLDRLEASVRSTVTAVAGRTVPLAEEGRRLDQEVHAMFEALLAAKHPQRARKQIRRVYYDLQETGAISWRADAHYVAPDGDEPADDVPFGFPNDAATAGSAESAPKQQDRGALRDIYRRLVEALHPDIVQDEADKAHRTEVMKDITIAFREGDFARLVEIERTWAAAPAPMASERDVERRHAALIETNRELRKQLRELEKQLRALRRSPEGQLASDIDRHGQSGRDAGIAGVVEAAESELNELREMHAFVGAFRDGKMSLAEFLDGPARNHDVDEAGDFEAALAALMSIAEEEAAMNRRPRAPGKNSGRKPRRGRA